MADRRLILLAIAVLPSLALAEAWFPGADDLAPFQRSGTIERYSPETLWERIDGEAELYRRFGLIDAAAAYFEAPEDASRVVEVTVFRLRSPLDAFGVYASFRDPTAPETLLGNGGQVGEALGVFWHGATFVHLHAAGPDGEAARDLQRAATTLAGLLGPAPRPPGELARFEALTVPRTVRFQPDHLLGREALPPGLEGTSRRGPRVAVATVTEGADRALDAYERVLQGAVRSTQEGIERLVGNDPAQGPVTVGVRGGRLAAVLAGSGAPETGELLRDILGDRP